MTSLTVKSLLLAGVLSCTTVPACIAQTYSGYWVVGNAADHTCQIVTSNPVIEPNPSAFGSGPYQSRDDANLARSTISVCPKEDPGTLAGHQMMPEQGAPDEPED